MCYREPQNHILIKTAIFISKQYDGTTNTDHTPYLIDLVNQGSVIIPDFDIPIPDYFVYREEPWHLYVPGSELAFYSVFGLCSFYLFILNKT